MNPILDTAIELLKEVGTHVLGHVLGDQANKRLEGQHRSPNEDHYLMVRDQLTQLSRQHDDGHDLQQQRLALEKEALAVQTQLSKDYLAHLHEAQRQEVELRVQEIQANYDNQHWAGVLSRQETLSLLNQSAAAKTRLLMVVSEPDVSDTCPTAFQHDLGKEVRGKLKKFLETHFPPHSDTAVEFYGKFFKSAVFDTEVKQIEQVLAPLHLATIFSDVTRKEIMFHLRLWFGADAPVFSLATSFPWKAEHKRLLAEGMDDEDSLEQVMDAMVAIHQLLTGLLADMYFLWLNPLHQPRLCALAENQATSDKFPAEWLETVLAAVRDMQEKRLAEYEKALREIESSKELVPQTPKNEYDDWETIGKYKVKGGLAIDSETGLMWLRFAVGQRWENGAVQGQAKEVCEKPYMVAQSFNNVGYGGYNDWRLPTSDELKTLLDYCEGDKIREIQFINNKVFPVNPYRIWSSCAEFDSIYSSDTTILNQYVNFFTGKVCWTEKYLSYWLSVRLTRKIE
ncbi:MAG: DUF1566 domain-containing protein [Candidatus Methylumidiphilus sp.]